MIKPNREEIRIIRETAKDGCRREGQRLVRVEAGKRCALTLEVDPSINILLVDHTPEWEDSDLFDFVDWSEFKKGIPEAPGGRAMVDFYCYDREGLCTNVQARFDGGRLVWTGIDAAGRWGYTFHGDDALRGKGFA